MRWALRKPHCATSLTLYLTTTLFSIHPRMKHFVPTVQVQEVLAL
jgi:hypothetical protein